MKPYCLSIAFLVLVLNLSFAEIRNGYAGGINTAHASLKVCNSLLLEAHLLTPHKRKKLEAKLRDLIKYITYYEVTENLLKQLRAISPELYNEIDTIKDRNGKVTDVYIRFIPEDEASVPAWGVTGIAHTAADPNTYLSEFGERSVSIKVWAVSHALLVLSHELGHVQYIVPNLAAYKNYHAKYYRPGLTESNHVGHNSDDPSGKCALEFERKFRASYYACYLKKNHAEFESPAALVTRIRREILARMVSAMPLARL